MRAVINFFGEIKLELDRVTWPTRNETIKLTLIVFAVSVIIGVYVGGLDYTFTRILGLIVAK
ncbi:MAG: Preprotein translocase, SecE subunit [Candidatus Woesebacteria bacterium GW2011_GWA2_40_7b]|uniref:Protein translocase subunit SecE n=1 Tax=Candidatus Woesebacteria bacterium GW2011_GWA2_40_7b TaxID=1618563 RepID=A0A0G0T2S4_9BACT|nr:MAG: Preprotein translocase, SecE subunit [Candidatus Woesebacteria bacterium GW2011_GWA2_40_7b]